MDLLHQTLESRALELAYERTRRQLEAIDDAERLRQLRVGTLLLKDDNDDLHTQMAQDVDRTDGLERFNEQLQEELEACDGKLESAQGDLRIKLREVETLKAELNSLHGVTIDSTKLLTEKLTLARELSALKSEVDYLRSQAASHQSLFAEKLSLQRELSTVKVELQSEKHATQRALAKEGSQQAEDARFESRLESLQADLAKERRERQRIEHDARKGSVESENRIVTLESRLNAFRNKVRSTKEQLKDAQASLQMGQSSSHGYSRRAPPPLNSNMFLAENTRKRAAAQLDADTIIGTPGDLPAAKKSKRVSTVIGEKSTFSITPFLNRTASVAPESPPSGNANGGDGEHVKGSDRLSSKSKQQAVSSEASSDVVDDSDVTNKVMQANKPGVLERAKTGRYNSGAPPARKKKAGPTLEQVIEENNQREGSMASKGEPAGTKDLPNETYDGGLDLKRRKRKLLGGGPGNILFDEEQGDGLNGSLRVGVKGVGTLGKGGLGALKFGPRTAISSSTSTFAAISPLKKDRKGAL